MSILIISSLQDGHACALMKALEARGDTAVELLDLSEFPTQLALSMAFQDGTRRFTLQRAGGGRLDLSKVSAVWWRRAQPFKLPDRLTDPAHRRFAMSEAATAFHGLYRAMDTFWVNDPVRDAAAHHKPWQLALAQEIGLEIPTTLMTNDPEEACEFWRQHDDRVIYKQFLALPEVWRETRRLRPEEVKLADAVRVTPVIFQRHVEAVADIRVTAIGSEVYAASADVRNAEYPLDVRMNFDVRYEPHKLPPLLEDRLLTLMRRLGLEYGAIDLRLTPDGRYVFLEINPSGQFLYIELATEQKITATLAAHLVNAGTRMKASTV